MVTVIASIGIGVVILALCTTQGRASDKEVRYRVDYSRIMRGNKK